MLLGTLPLLAVGSAATAGNSSPPRNGLIAVRGGEGITIVDPQTGASTSVPKSVDLDQPAWSPDGTRLAVTSWSDEAGDDVYTMKPDGTDRTLVLRSAGSPSWSPDGKQLVVVRETDVATGLMVVNADGTGARALQGTSDASGPEWSPDGTRIAFIDSNGRVALITPEGVAASTPSRIEATEVSWSPDSSKLAYAVDRKDGGLGVATLDLASGHETLIAGGQESAQSPVWSPVGDQIAFQSETSTSTTKGCGSHIVSELWVMNADGSNARSAAPSITAYGAPSWAQATATVPAPTSVPTKLSAPKPSLTPTPSSKPAREAAPAPVVTSNPTRATAARPAPRAKPLRGIDGRIAVRGKGGLYLVDPSTAASREIPGTGAMWAPAWSPTRTELAVEKAEKDGTSSIYTISPDGTHAQLVLPNASAPSWSAAGDRILAVRSEDLYSVSADGTDARLVDPDDSDAYTSRELAWPVDGSAIHFFDDESLSGPGTFNSDAATWSPDETELAFTGALHASEDEGRDNGLWIVSAEGGSPTLLLGGAVGRPSWAR